MTRKTEIRSSEEEIFSAPEALRKYMSEYKPSGVERERRMTPEMKMILESSLDSCSYGLKTHWNAVESKKKLTYVDDDFLKPTRPKTIEIHLNAGDLENYRREIDSCLKTLCGKQNLYISIHEPLPMLYNNMPLDLSTSKKAHLENTVDCLQTLCDICENNKMLGFVSHPWPHTPSKNDFQSLIRNLKNLEDNIKDKMFLENVFNFHTTERIKEAYNAGCEICYDIAHGQLLLGSDELIESVKELGPVVKYWHFSDVDKDKHGFSFKGVVPFGDIIPFTEGVIIMEVRNEDETRPIDMVLTMHSIEFLKCMSQENIAKVLEKHRIEM
jgi:sugar phosphate isomerase/epimerase